MADSIEIITTPESGPNAPAPLTPAPFVPEEAPADLTKSYAELRAKFTQVTQENAALKKGAPDPAAPAADAPVTPDPAKPAEQTPPVDPDKPQESPTDAAQKVADAAGFDLSGYNTEYENTGDVTEESRVKIAEGLAKVLGADARSIVDQFIEGQKAVHANDRALAFSEAGGEDAYGEMVTWAKDALTPDEAKAYNTAVNSGDRNTSLLAIRGLRSKFEAANGVIPNNVTASGGNIGGGVQPFTSAAEMVRAMSDPLYKTDEAYRAKVKARLAANPNL